jgi:cytochrome c553
MKSAPGVMVCTVIVGTLLGAICARALAAPRQGTVVPGSPDWAYGVPAIGAARVAAPAAPADDGSPKHVPDSEQAFTLPQLRDSFVIADWFPGDHPVAPGVVMKGRRPDVRACGLCHYPNGRGRPENAGLDGLPAEYIAQQMSDFAHDRRRSAESRKTNTGLMISLAKAMTPGEVAEAALYFSSIPRTKWIRVVESATVPKTRLSGGMFVPLDGTETEPLAGRLIEMPEHPDLTELRDSRAGFVVHVPVGSVARGETLVKTGAGKTTGCAVCHGLDLNGLGPVPGLAGRSPSYTVRQLWDMKTGARHGVWSDLMKGVVANLTTDDMAAIAAYLAGK